MLIRFERIMQSVFLSGTVTVVLMLACSNEQATASSLSQSSTGKMNDQTLAENSYRIGNFEEAINEWNKCIAIDPKQSDYYFARAQVHKAMNEDRAAIADLTTSIKLR